jgi:hypothetical protein
MSKKESADPAIDLPPVGPILGSRGNRLSFPNTRLEEVKLVSDGAIFYNFTLDKSAFILKVYVKNLSQTEKGKHSVCLTYFIVHSQPLPEVYAGNLLQNVCLL